MAARSLLGLLMIVLRAFVRVVLTLVVAAAALVLGSSLWRTYMVSPWTRDGRVRA